MGNSTSNSARLFQEAQNNFMALQDNQCISTNTRDASGNVTVVVGGNVKNITGVDLEGEMNASCSINQQIVQTATSILSSQSKQLAKTVNDLFNDGVIYSQDVNSAAVTQSIMNNISNVTSNTCNAVISESLDNNIMVVYGTNSDQVIGVKDSTNSNASCAVTNMTKQDAYNRQQSSASSSATNEGMFAGIALAVIGCLILGMIVLVIFFAVGGAGIFMFGGKKKDDGEAVSGETEEGGLADINDEDTLQGILEGLTSDA